MLLNDWHDIVRVVAFFVSLYCVVILAVRWKQKRNDWNVKTLDYWYALTMWSLAGCVFTIQGVILDRPLTPGFVILLAAIFVTGKGVHRQGPWGGS